MSPRKPPACTPDLLASNRRCPKKSAGPKTAHARAGLRLIGPNQGWRSPELSEFLKDLLDAPPCQAGRAAPTVLQCKLVHHPFLEAAELSVQTEIAVSKQHRLRARP